MEPSGDEPLVASRVLDPQPAPGGGRQIHGTHAYGLHRLVGTDEALRVNEQAGRPVGEHGGRSLGTSETVERQTVGEPIRHTGELDIESGVVEEEVATCSVRDPGGGVRDVDDEW